MAELSDVSKARERIYEAISRHRQHPPGWYPTLDDERFADYVLEAVDDLLSDEIGTAVEKAVETREGELEDAEEERLKTETERVSTQPLAKTVREVVVQAVAFQTTGLIEYRLERAAAQLQISVDDLKRIHEAKEETPCPIQTDAKVRKLLMVAKTFATTILPLIEEAQQ